MLEKNLSNDVDDRSSTRACLLDTLTMSCDELQIRPGASCVLIRNLRLHIPSFALSFQPFPFSLQLVLLFAVLSTQLFHPFELNQRFLRVLVRHHGKEERLLVSLEFKLYSRHLTIDDSERFDLAHRDVLQIIHPLLHQVGPHLLALLSLLMAGCLRLAAFVLSLLEQGVDIVIAWPKYELLNHLFVAFRISLALIVWIFRINFDPLV